MQIRSVGIELGKTTFHLVALRYIGQGSGEEEVHTEAVAELHGEHADFADRPRSLFWSALSRSSVEAARP